MEDDEAARRDPKAQRDPKAWVQQGSGMGRGR